MVKTHAENNQKLRDDLSIFVKKPILGTVVLGEIVLLSLACGGIGGNIERSNDPGLQGEQVSEQEAAKISARISALVVQTKEWQDIQGDVQFGKRAKAIGLIGDDKKASAVFDALIEKSDKLGHDLAEGKQQVFNSIAANPDISEKDTGELYTKYQDLMKQNGYAAQDINVDYMQECRQKFQGPDANAMAQAVAECTVNYPGGLNRGNYIGGAAGGLGLSSAFVMISVLPWLLRRRQINAANKGQDKPENKASDIEADETVTHAKLVIKTKREQNPKA